MNIKKLFLEMYRKLKQCMVRGFDTSTQTEWRSPIVGTSIVWQIEILNSHYG